MKQITLASSIGAMFISMSGAVLAQTALGTGAVADAGGSVAIGQNAQANQNGTSVGTNTMTSLASTALGYGASATGQSSVALGDGSVATQAGTVSVGSGVPTLPGDGFQTRRIVNVTDGVGAHDAATVGQLNAAIAGVSAGTTDTVARDAAATAQTTADNATTLANSVNLKMSTTLTSVATAQATADSAVAGVANAMRYTDTVAAKTLQQANAYTDLRVDQLGGRIGALESKINDVERSAYRGIAASIAMQQAPASIGPGESAVMVGAGGYGSETALAVGVHHVTRGNVAISGGVAASPSGGSIAYRLGGSFKF